MKPLAAVFPLARMAMRNLCGGGPWPLAAVFPLARMAMRKLCVVGP